MPFSSFFNRKGSRKNQSKDQSGQIKKQNHSSGDGTTEEVHKSEAITEKTEHFHADSASQEMLKVEEKTYEVTEVHTEASVSTSIQNKHSTNQTLFSDYSNEIKMDVEKGVSRLKEYEIQMERNKNLNLAKSNKVENSKLRVECVDERDNCLDTNDQEQRDSNVTHRENVPISQNSSIGEANQLNTKSGITESVSEQHTDRDELTELKDVGINSHEGAAKEIIVSPCQKMRHSEDIDLVGEHKLEEGKGKEVKIYGQESISVTQTHTSPAELSNKEHVVFSETNCSKESQTNESAVNVLEYDSPGELPSVVANIHEQESESLVNDCNDNANSVLPAKTASENEQLKDIESSNSENETEEKINSMDIAPPKEILTDNSTEDFSNEHVINDSQIAPDKEQNVATENEEMKVQSGPPSTECEVFEEIANLDAKSTLNEEKKECEFESISEKDSGNESSRDLELRTEARTPVKDETTEGDRSTEKLLNCGSAEHTYDTENIQDDEILSMQQLSVNSPSVISDSVCTNEKNETETMVDKSLQNSGKGEEKEPNEVNNEDNSSRAEILENNSFLIANEEDDISSPRDCAEVTTIQSPLEDSLDSFPSGCEDFLGGQRTLMAVEQHPPPSWKVGYLQVKLPAKSRGRGKLKVWRQRWVVIQMDEFVKDTKNPSLMINIYASECSNARRHSVLFFCTVSASKTVVYRSQSKTHKYAFSLTVDSDVVLHLAADSETASQEWIAAIRNLLWPPNPVLQLEKVLHGSDFEVSIIDNEFSFRAGLLGTYGNMKVTSNKLILSHPQTDHVIQEWYLNTLDKFQLLPQSKEEDAFKVVVMHTGQDSSTGSGQIILFCPEAVIMLQSIATTIHKFLQYRTTAGKDHNQQELEDLAEWLSPAMSSGNPPEDYYKVPRRQIKSLLDIPNFSLEKPISTEGLPRSQEFVVTKPSMLTSATSASTFSEDSGISMAIHPDDFLNCSVTSFTIGGRPVRDHTSSESSDGYSPPCTPEMSRKQQETEAI